MSPVAIIEFLLTQQGINYFLWVRGVSHSGPLFVSQTLTFFRIGTCSALIFFLPITPSSVPHRVSDIFNLILVWETSGMWLPRSDLTNIHDNLKMTKQTKPRDVF